MDKEKKCFGCIEVIAKFEECREVLRKVRTILDVPEGADIVEFADKIIQDLRQYRRDDGVPLSTKTHSDFCGFCKKNTPCIHYKFEDKIDEIVNKIDYDYRDSCGANNCECYKNSVKIDAIIKVLNQILQ